ncbi:glutathione S-transferase family protein [Pseudomonas sp. NPDC090203]|jgi:glutathione S-transferase|uniref:glutathione S-transferase family protein n=1 Tax=Pseudomonas sp. NPDC090203 TaxID=3364477 RepID=UPI00380CA1FD
MLLYQFPMGTNPRRVAIYIAEKGLDVPQYTLDHVKLEHRSAAYLQINPAGRAPTLVTHEGAAITESAAIVEYLEELYPENPMIGTDPLSRAQVRALERIGSDLIVRSQLWLWNVTGAFPRNEPEPSQVFAAKLFRHVEELLDLLELAIADKRFLAGDRPTIADCTVFAIFQTARERFNLPFGTSHPRLDAWYRHFRTRPSADY